MGPVELEIFKGVLSAIPEEMGMRLRRSSFSANIKERLDFSCALFDADGSMVAQAAHIPVHLGAMPLSVQACIEELKFGPGDVAILNDPYRGGTHLPDITLVSPIFLMDDLAAGGLASESGVVVDPTARNEAASGRPAPFAYAASRAHHADVGGMAPGSMPLSTDIREEGVLIPPAKIVEAGQLNHPLWEKILSQVRTPDERSGDLRAQLAANRVGGERMLAVLKRYGRETIQEACAALMDYGERVTRVLLRELPDGEYRFRDYMDDDGQSEEPVEIVVSVTVKGDRATVDFTGTAEQRPGNTNAVYAITLSAVHYVFRCLLPLEVPSTSGSMRPIEVVAPDGSLVNARFPAAVAAGNVETSQRIVDCLFGALAQAAPTRIPAASQGTMNNLALGGWDAGRQRNFAYYETIAGGMGARPGKAGASGIHTHMTNTLNTPTEALEFDYPLRVRRYSIRRGSGGVGAYQGGDGIVREIELLGEAQISLLSERRRFGPYGLAGGTPGQVGRNLLIRDGKERELPGKVSVAGRQGDRIRIETPGGGGHSPPPAPAPPRC